jgi:hypothetical protein
MTAVRQRADGRSISSASRSTCKQACPAAARSARTRLGRPVRTLTQQSRGPASSSTSDSLASPQRAAPTACPIPLLAVSVTSRQQSLQLSAQRVPEPRSLTVPSLVPAQTSATGTSQAGSQHDRAAQQRTAGRGHMDRGSRSSDQQQDHPQFRRHRRRRNLLERPSATVTLTCGCRKPVSPGQIPYGTRVVRSSARRRSCAARK